MAFAFTAQCGNNEVTYLRLRLPDRYKKALTHVAGYSNDVIDNLLAALERIKPSVFSSDLYDQIADDVTDISRGEARTLADTLVSLYILKDNTGRSTDDFAQDVIEALRSDAPDDNLWTEQIRSRF